MRENTGLCRSLIRSSAQFGWLLLARSSDGMGCACETSKRPVLRLIDRKVASSVLRISRRVTIEGFVGMFAMIGLLVVLALLF